MTGRIYDRLVQKFGREAIFKDVDSIPLGVDFRQHIDSVISKCAVVLVVIGDRWLGTTGGAARRRLDDSQDFVRIEIESALQRNIPVIPLLLQNVTMPAEENLPPSLKELAYRNGINIGHDPHFHTDMDRLIKNLEPFFAGAPGTKEQAAGRKAEGYPDQSNPLSTPHASEETLVDHALPGTSRQEVLRAQSPHLIGPDARRRTFLLYVLVVVITFALYFSILFILPSIGSSGIFWFLFLGNALFQGIVLGSAQAALLRRYIRFIRGWVVATALGAAAAGLSGLILGRVVGELSQTNSEFLRTNVVTVVFALNFALRGLFIGTAQWVVLRKLVHDALLWVVAGTAAEAAAYTILKISSYTISMSDLPGAILIGILSGCVIGAVQGLCLLYFRKKGF